MKKKKTTSKAQLGSPVAVAKVAAKAAGVANAASQKVKSYPGFFTLAGFGLLSFLGYALVKKVKNDSEDKIQDHKETNFSNNLTTSILKDSKGKSYNPRELASRYKQAIIGGGTNEQTLMDLARISKNGRWAEISNQYKVLTGNALLTDIQDDLDSWEYNTFSSILHSTYWYATGEYVYPKKTKVLGINNAKKMVFVDTTWNAGHLGRVTHKKRYKIRGKIIEFYKTEDYPNHWIVVSDLYTMYNRVG